MPGQSRFTHPESTATRERLIYARAVADHASQSLEREFLEFAPDAVIGVDQTGEIKLVNSRTQACSATRATS